MPILRFLAALAACVTFVGVSSAWSQTVGVAMAVTQGAVVEKGRQRTALAPRSPISQGDVILTDSSGTVQIVFNDRTRVVVGPSSRFEVTDVRIEPGKTASRFAVEAVSGTFRFLSGQSDKRAYSITTPTATMGIRGTQFDFTVVERRETSLVTFDGQVRICARGRTCALVSGGCATVQATRRGRIEQPADRRERALLLGSQFPFIVSQDRLARPFRTSTGSCGRVAVPVVIKDPIPQVQQFKTVTAQVEAPPPPPPPPPPPEPPAPPPSDAGYPGQSGSPGQGVSNGEGHQKSNGLGHGKPNPGRGNGSGGGSASGSDNGGSSGGSGGRGNGNGRGKAKGHSK